MEKIPQEFLDRQHRRLCRHVASVLVQAMADSDVNFAIMDARLGWDEGTARKKLYALIEADTEEMREVSDVATALGREFRCSVQRIDWPEPEVSP